jgi:hypothetical protein
MYFLTNACRSDIQELFSINLSERCGRWIFLKDIKSGTTRGRGFSADNKLLGLTFSFVNVFTN